MGSSLFLRCVAALACASCFSLPSRAQTVQVFGGYSFARTAVPIGFFSPAPVQTSQNVSLNGWEVQGQVKFLGALGVVADFGGNYGNLRGGNTRMATYLFGPSLSLHTRVAPFAHLLIGGAHQTQQDPSNPNFFSLGSATSFATAVGGGIDAKLLPFISVRLIQIDFMHTDFHGGGQSFPRISAGLVLHF
jgi:hypothetical protein